MKALKKIAKRVRKEKVNAETAEILKQFVSALVKREPVALHLLYDLDYEDFELVLVLLADWRLDCFNRDEALINEILQTARTTFAPTAASSSEDTAKPAEATTPVEVTTPIEAKPAEIKKSVSKKTKDKK